MRWRCGLTRVWGIVALDPLTHPPAPDQALARNPLDIPVSRICPVVLLMAAPAWDA